MNQKNKPTQPHFSTSLLRQYAKETQTTLPVIAALTPLEEWLLTKNYDVSMELIDALEEIAALKRQLGQ